MKKKKLLSIIILLVMLITNITQTYAKFLTENETLNLVKDHTCASLLKIKGSDMMKTVVYVVYRVDGKNYPAFCVQPEKDRCTAWEVIIEIGDLSVMMIYIMLQKQQFTVWQKE